MPVVDTGNFACIDHYSNSNELDECAECIDREEDKCNQQADLMRNMALSSCFLEECGCFPSDATVNVLGKGDIRIDQLQLGDQVQTSSGYSKVYAFGYAYTSDEDGVQSHQYVQIKTNDTEGTTLELSPNHVLFVGGKSAHPKMAKDVAVGDIVQLFAEGVGSKASFAEIISIENTEKSGQYAPLTEDGTIVVNNILASVHSIEGAASEVKLFGITIINMHQFEQMLFAPLRLLCKFSFDDFCSPALHDEEYGTHNWDSVTEHLIDMLTYDTPDLETANFLSLSITLPFKLFVLFGMIAANAIEIVLNMKLKSLVLCFSLFLLTIIRFFGYTIKAKKIVKKVD